MGERFYLYPTLDPGNPLSEKINVKFPATLVERWQQNEITQFYNLETAKKVLDNPRRIFYGTRALHEGWWCYTGKPDTWYIREGVTSTFPGDKVFAVLLNVDFEIYGFRSEVASPDDPFSPMEWQKRYERCVWKSKP